MREVLVPWQLVIEFDSKGALTGKRVLITGSSEGLGLTIAEACCESGAHVALCARTEKTLKKAFDDIRRRFPSSKVLALTADVGEADDRESLMESVTREFGGLDCLVNNAAISGPKGGLDDIDWSQWVQTLEVNLFGTVDLCRRALPFFRAQGHGKIVNLSGGGATSPMPRFSAYGVSKAAVVRFTENLAEELKGTNIHVNAVAPGMLATRLLREIVAEGPEKVGEKIHRQMSDAVEKGGAPPEKAAALCVYLLSAASDGITGRLLSAVWDRWTQIGEHKHELSGSDIYTLRRIVPEDRGKSWGGE